MVPGERRSQDYKERAEELRETEGKPNFELKSEATPRSWSGTPRSICLAGFV